MTTVGKRILERRIQLNISQEELASKVGYKDRSSIARIELGERDIRQNKVILFAKALNTTPQWLMGYDDEESTLAHLKDHAAHLVKENAPNDEVRSAIMDKVNHMTDSQARKFLEFLNSMGE